MPMPSCQGNPAVTVLFLLGDLEMGGAQRVVLTVLRHLDRERFSPHLGLVRERGPLQGEIPAGVPVHKLRSGRVRYAFLPIVRLCRSLRPDVVLSTLGHLNLMLLMARPLLPRHVRVMVREANTPSIRLEHTRFPQLYHFSYRMLYPLGERVICNCEAMKTDLVAHFSLRPDRITVIPNPVDEGSIRRQVRAEPNPYRGPEIQIVSVGRLNYQKGFDLLLRAFRRCHGRLPNARLTIVGEGPEEASLRLLAHEYGISGVVSFAGQQANPFPYMAHADFLVLSSRWEGSPNTVLEALGCGTPVLAFDCPGGTAEIITEGRNGWLVPAEDWEGLAERMIHIVERKEGARLKGGSLVPDRHRCGNVVRQWESVFTGEVA